MGWISTEARTSECLGTVMWLSECKGLAHLTWWLLAVAGRLSQRRGVGERS